MPRLVSVVVTNWNGRHYLEACLAALSAQTYPAIEVIVVDNGSTDGSQAWVTEHYPSVRLICNATNIGFAAANNQGVREAGGDYIALLNNDTRVEPGWLAALVAAAERNPRIGMVASRMIYLDRPHMINSTGICLDRCGITWDRGTGQTDNDTDDELVAVFGPCAGAALYRQELFQDVGLFDESFFIYLEDVDLAWRARWRGWQAVYVPAAKVHHMHSATMREGSPRKTYLLARNKISLLAKNYAQPYLMLCLPLILFYELLSFGFAILNGVGWSALTGRLAGLAALPQAWRHRRVLWSRPHVSAREIFELLEPAAWPWQVYNRYRHQDRSAVRKKMK